MKNKAKRTKGKHETTELLLNVPEIFIDQCIVADVSELLNKFNNASSVEEQIEIIRALSGHLNNTSDNTVQCILAVLSDLFVNASSKSPVKKSILRTFANSSLQSQISTILSKQLLTKLTTVDEQHLQSCNECVSAVNDCFDNCPAGVAAVSIVLENVFTFLVCFLKRLVNELSESISPVIWQEVQQFIHNCTRCFVAVCSVQSVLSEYTDDIFQYCTVILNNADVSFDTKNNLGIVLVTAANCSVQNGYITLLQMCLTKDISKWNISSSDLEDDMTVACICSGVLNVINAEELSLQNEILASSPLLIMCNKLLQLAESSAGNPSAILGVNRSLLLVSRSLGPLNDTDLAVIVTKLLGHIWTQLDHYIDTIRHVAMSTLVNLVKIAKNRSNNDNNGLLNIIIDSVFKTPKNRSTRYRGLSVISQEAGCSILLSKEPTLVVQLLTQSLDCSVSTYVLSCYENLMRCHLKETEDDFWLQTWVLPLVQAISNDKELDKTGACLQNLLIIAIKLKPSILDSILSQWSTDNEVHLSSLLKCTLMTRRIGVKVQESEGKWRGLLDYCVLNLGMCHQNDEVRVSSLSLVAESQKSTEIFTDWELEYIVTFLCYNINTQLPSTRQQIMALIKKILIRFDDGYYTILRDTNRLTEKTPEDTKTATLHHKTHYERFVFNLRDCVFDSLFPGANFSRRIICLETLTLLEPILTKVLASLAISADQLWKQAEADAILLCLHDSYESNKKLATSLLKQCPPQLLHLHTIEGTKRFIQDALALAASVKPADTVTAAYMLETAGYSPVLSDTLLKMQPAEAVRTPEYHMICTLLAQLQSQVETGTENLLKAASCAPMHGTLFCLRHLMEKHLFSCNNNNAYWQPIVSRIIETCFAVTAIVGPIVNNSSPEGHLPMDQKGVCEEDATITAQMLLVCAWRSVKEVSLLLGEITLKLSIESGDHCGLIAEQEMLKIGEHFTVLLMETKHRGAFEQAYVGFAKLCVRLWKCKSEVLHQLPVAWLTEIMNAISGKTQTNNKLCATRRSAGVPFMIQAIVTSELHCGSSTHFAQCMETLLQLANSHGDAVERRTHAMNVLRAMYRHTQLGEVVTPYVAAGITASILGFSRKTWAERNSATLLFSSLMTRIFGVQRSRDADTLSIRNRMTARVFFLRHPTLHNFLLEQLRQLTADGVELYKEVGLYPILLLLARLYPSTLEEDTNNELEDYIPYVKSCAKNRVLKTRELAAKALVPLVPTQKRNALIEELFLKLESERCDQNYIHGVLLQILHLLKSTQDFKPCFNVETIIQNTLWILTTMQHTCNAICASIYMDIIILLTSNKQELDKTLPIWQEILTVLSEQDNFIQPNFIIGKTVYQRTASHLQLHILFNISSSSFEEIIAHLSTQLSHDSNDIRDFILNFIITCLRTPDTEFLLNTFEIPEVEKNLASSLLPSFKTFLLQFLQKNPTKFVEKLIKIVKCEERLCSRALFIVSHCAQAAMTLGRQDGGCYFKDKIYTTHDDDVATGVLCCIRTCINNLRREESFEADMEEMFDILLEFSSLNNAVGCRYVVALILVENAELILGGKQIKYEYLVTLWRIVMQLLEDSEPVVRNTISKLSKSSATAEKCRETLLSSCVDRLKRISVQKCTALLLFWALADRDPCASEEDFEGQVFERGEVNTYVESMCLSKLSAKMLKNLVSCKHVRDIRRVFQSFVNILNTNTQLFTDFIEKEIFITILQELLQEFSQNRNTNVFKDYFNNSQNTWHNLNPIFKYKIHQIVQNVVPDNLIE